MRRNIIRAAAIVITLAAVAYMGISARNVNAADPAGDKKAATPSGFTSAGGMGVHKGEADKEASPSEETGTSGGGGGGQSGGSQGGGSQSVGDVNYSGGGGGGGGGCCG